MTEGSKWRVELARKIAPFYAENPKVVAILVGGSVSYGVADRYSDVEIGVYWTESPTANERKAISTRTGATEGRFEPFPRNANDPDDGADEDIYIGGDSANGFQIDVKHRTVEATEWLLDNHTGDLREVIPYAIPLYGRSLIEKWKSQITLPSREQAGEEVSQQLRLWPWWLIKRFAEENEVLLTYKCLSLISGNITAALATLNRMQLPFGKYTEWSMEQVPLKPANFWPRYEQLFREEPLVAVRQLHALVEDTFALVATNSPEVDTRDIKREASDSAPTWIIRSALHLESIDAAQRALLEKLTQSYTANTQVEAVLLSGGTSNRPLDRYVDVELNLFWSRPPTEQERRTTIVVASGENINILPCDHDIGIWQDTFSIDGLKVDTRHYEVSAFQDLLSA